MITTLLAEDHGLVRTGIRLILEKSGRFSIVAEAEDGLAAVTCAEKHRPQLAVLDFTMPRMNGLEATKQIRRLLPGTSILIVSMHKDFQYVYEAMHAGANGYVLKQAAYDELLAAAEQVMTGQAYFSPGLSSPLMEEYLRNPYKDHVSTELERLTDRERQVLQLVAEGNSTMEIATLLGLSHRTVESYREKIMLKLNLHSIADLTRFALRNGLCPPER